MQQYPTFVAHLECSETGKSYPADQLHGLSEVGKPLLVRYWWKLDTQNLARV